MSRKGAVSSAGVKGDADNFYLQSLPSGFLFSSLTNPLSPRLVAAPCIHPIIRAQHGLTKTIHPYNPKKNLLD